MLPSFNCTVPAQKDMIASRAGKLKSQSVETTINQAPGRLHLEVQQGTQVNVVPTRHLLFTANATFDLLIPAQQIQTQYT